jgi:uncharacterized NAD(P)/FAD-binding protein YdhS
MHTLDGRLLELVGKLDSLGPRPSLIDLAHAIEASQLTPADVAPFVQTNPRSYNRAPVVVREHYELLVMTWLPGQASVPHDHNGSTCVMRVMHGEATEGCHCVASDGFVDLEYEEVVRTGEVSAGQDAGIHTVRNASRAGETLVTVHVYAPPLRDFRRFVPRLRSDRRRTIPDSVPTVVIVGGGFSGSMTAAQILHRTGAPVHVSLIERRGTVGDGLAYATREPVHLLNVPAGRMSAWPDRPDDFLEWALQRYGNVLATDFVPRQWYGKYIRETLLAADAGDPARLSIIFDEVRRVARHPSGGWIIHLERGSSMRADAVVLAIGHRPPSDPIGRKWIGPRTRLIADPWRPFAMNAISPDEAVVVLGSGLTAVDAALSLASQPRSAEIAFVSRNGLLPQAHAETPLPPADMEPLVSKLIVESGGVRARTLLQQFRRTVQALAEQGIDWRSVVDGLRPHTARLWQAMPATERRRFLSRLRAFWEVHRHRMSFPVARRFQMMLNHRDVRMIAGRVVSVREEGNNVRVFVRLRGTGLQIELSAGWVVNCTGPMPSNSPDSNPVIGSLLVQGQLCLDELALGVETTATGNAIAADGVEVPDMFVVGTLRKPAFWESTAVPELRGQAATVAEQVLDRLKLHSQTDGLESFNVVTGGGMGSTEQAAENSTTAPECDRLGACR